MGNKKDCAITFGATNNYVFALANVLLGIKKYTVPFWDDIIILHTDITSENQQVINAILPCKFVHVEDDEWCEQLERNLSKETMNMYSLATFFRYYCFDFLKEYRKVIWLDCDLLVQNDISGIADYGEKTGFAACMADRMAPVEMCFGKLIPGYQMFVPLVNAGTLVLTDKLPHYEIFCDWCKNKTVGLINYLDMPDQGILNLLLQEFHIEVETIDVGKYQRHPDFQKAIPPKEAFILHSYGIRKFWNDAIYQKLYPEWQEFNHEYLRLSEAITKKRCVDQGQFPLVSVVMSTYTRDEFLYDAVESILEQTYPNFELIIVVEYSEKQEKIAKRLRKYEDKRIIVICNRERLGFARSLNIGMGIAKGKYIARMDDDDKSYPERLQKQVEYMELHPEIGILGTFAETFMNCHDIWNSYPTDPEQAAIGLLRGTVLCHPTVMMRVSELQKYNLQYNPEVFTEDYDLWARAVKYLKISNLPEILYGYRASGMNVTVNQETKIHSSHLKIMRLQFENYLNMKPSEDELCLFNGRVDTLGMVYTKNRSEAEKVYKSFIQKISEANKKTNFYNQEKLDSFLGIATNEPIAEPSVECAVEPRKEKISLVRRIKRAIKRLLKPYATRAIILLGQYTCNVIAERFGHFEVQTKEQLNNINTEMNGLNDRINELKNKTSELYEIISEMDDGFINKINEVNDRSSNEIKSKIDEMKNRINESIDRTNGEVNDKASEIKSRLSEMSDRTSREVNSRINELIDRTNRVVDDRASEIKSGLNEMSDRTSCEVNSRINDLNGRINEVEQSINTHALWNTDDIKKDLFNFRYLYEKTEKIPFNKTNSIYSAEFYENNRYHSYISAMEVFRRLLPVINPQTVFDFGCGSGTWLYAAKMFGVNRVHGVDGDWVDHKMLMIDEAEFEVQDVSEPYQSKEKYDLACSLEVSEHIEPQKSEVFIDNLCKISDIVLFSGAHPNQGGDGHINERSYDYWKELFAKHGYDWIDVRPLFSENEKICSWYRENMGLYVKGIGNKNSILEKLF